jgi:hypothetical protein
MSIVKWLTFQKGVKASHFTAPFPYPPASWGRSGAGAPLLSGGARVAKKVARQGATNGKAGWQSGFVTGAARGLGRAYAKRLAGLEAKVAVADLDSFGGIADFALPRGFDLDQ